MYVNCQYKPLSATFVGSLVWVPFVVEMKLPISNFTKIRRMGAALIHADKHTDGHGEGEWHTAHTYANASNNIFIACTVIFSPSGLPSYPSNSATCTFPPAMLYFRCLCILCLKSEIEKGNDISASPLSVSASEMRRVTGGRTGVCTDGCFATLRAKGSRHAEKHSVRTAPCCRGSQLN